MSRLIRGACSYWFAYRTFARTLSYQSNKPDCYITNLFFYHGAVVIALASHQCVPRSIPGPAVICGLSLLLVLFLAPRGFSPGTPVFPSPQKPTFPNSNSIWNCQALYHEPLARVIAQALPVFDIKFAFFTTYFYSCHQHRVLVQRGM